MHQSFDLYPAYLRLFKGDFDPLKACRLRYDLHAQRNYAYVEKNGKRVPEPQVRHEGSLELIRRQPVAEGECLQLSVNHVREWATYTDQEPASRQVLSATIEYRADASGSPAKWTMAYSSVPILPVKSYRYTELDTFRKSGTSVDGRLEITGAEGTPPAEYRTTAPLTTLYTLIDTLQGGRAKAGNVDYLDDLSQFRPGLELCQLPDSLNEIEGTPQTLTGHALVGPGLLPLYFWTDASSRVLAIIGRNVAYTLTEAVNLE